MTCPTTKDTAPGLDVADCCPMTGCAQEEQAPPPPPSPKHDPLPSPLDENEAPPPPPLENETEIPVDKRPTKKPRTTKKDKKDPSQPRKPLNAYMLFSKDELRKQEYVGISLPERSKMVGALWRQMDDAARAPYETQAAKDKAAFKPV